MLNKYIENGMLGVTELFIIHAKKSNILELNKNDLRENFFQLKQNEKYASFLKYYEYDENNICFLLEKELKLLVNTNQIIECKDSFYINEIKSDIDKMHLDEINDLVRQMVNDYVKLNMQKQKVKMD